MGTGLGNDFFGWVTKLSDRCLSRVYALSSEERTGLLLTGRILQ